MRTQTRRSWSRCLNQRGGIRYTDNEGRFDGELALCQSGGLAVKLYTDATVDYSVAGNDGSKEHTE